MEYTTIADVQNYMLEDIDPSYQPTIELFIQAVSAYINNLTGRDFSTSAEATERVFDGDNSDTLLIDPATEIISVRLSPDGEVVDPSGYYKYPINSPTISRIRMTGQYFSRGQQNIIVTAKWGEALPPDIKLAATVLVAGIINASIAGIGEGQQVVQSMTIGRYSVSYKTDSQRTDQMAVMDILQMHKRYTF